VGGTDFAVVQIDLDTFIFNDTSFQAEPGDDGAVNYGLFQVQIQSVFPESGNINDTTPRTDVDIRRVSLVMGQVPDVGLEGDFNDDDVVDLADVDFYNGNIGQPASFNPELDLDESGTIDVADLNLHIQTFVQTSNGGVGTAVGDLDLDGDVDVLGDAAQLVNNLGSSVTSWANGDVDGNGTVDVLSDAAALVNNLGFNNGGATAGE
jgi:hypothetical protein